MAVRHGDPAGTCSRVAVVLLVVHGVYGVDGVGGARVPGGSVLGESVVGHGGRVQGGRKEKDSGRVSHNRQKRELLMQFPSQQSRLAFKCLSPTLSTLWLSTSTCHVFSPKY